MERNKRARNVDFEDQITLELQFYEPNLTDEELNLRIEINQSIIASPMASPELKMKARLNNHEIIVNVYKSRHPEMNELANLPPEAPEWAHALNQRLDAMQEESRRREDFNSAKINNVHGRYGRFEIDWPNEIVGGLNPVDMINKLPKTVEKLDMAKERMVNSIIHHYGMQNEPWFANSDVLMKIRKIKQKIGLPY